MKASVQYIVAALVFGAPLVGCADWDNPTALSNLETEAQFEVEAARVETFEEVEIHVRLTEGGQPLSIREAEMEIEHETGGEVRVVAMQPEGDGYAAHVIFHEPGEHHLHFRGRPQRHNLMHEMGDHEIVVFRQHRVIGPYWVEMEVSPAPVLPGDNAHIHFHVFDLLPDGTPGAEAGGLDLELEVHDPAGAETPVLVVEEEAGEYEAEYAFGDAGMYELHLEIEVGGDKEDGEFHVPVLSEEDEGEGNEDEGGDGHGHG